MSESLTRSYDKALSDIAEDVQSMPKRRPGESEAEFNERFSRWRASNVVERGIEKLGRFS